MQKYGGKWNMAINQFQYPLQNTNLLIKEIKNHDDKINIKDAPSACLRLIFSRGGGDEDAERKIVFI